MDHIDFYIGDVHGRSDLLRKLIQFLGRHARTRNSHPRFTFLGDLIDRGPDSKSCIQMVIDTMDKAPGSVLLRGNHEGMMLETILSKGKCDTSGDWALSGGVQCIQSYAGELNLSKFFQMINTEYSHHIDALKNAKLYVQRGGLIAVHAGIDPTIKLEEQTERTLLWVRDSFLDYIDADMAPVIHGHTIINELPVVTENRISIDTGAVENSILTACIIDEQTQDISFAHATPNTVRYVEPIKLDRGYGTLMDNPERIFRTQKIMADTSVFRQENRPEYFKNL